MKSKLLCQLVSDGTKKPLFIVPAAGSTPLSLVRLARTLRSQRPVYSFEFAGMQDDQSAHKTIEEMASAYVAEIREVQHSGPYYLGGHCFGGLVALDIASKLEAMEEKVAVLVLLETIFPPSGNGRKDRGFTDEQDQLIATLTATKKAVELTFKQAHEQLALLPADLSECLGRFYRKQYDMSLTYRAKPIATDIALFRTRTHTGEIFQGLNELCLRNFSEYILPGDSISMLSPPVVGDVGARLNEVLAPFEQE